MQRKYFNCIINLTLLKIFLPVCSLMLMSGCISVQRYTGIINENFNAAANQRPAGDFSYLEFRDTVKISSNDSADIKLVKSYLVPALIYWQWEHTLETDLSCYQKSEIFKNEFMVAAESLHLSEKLSWKRLVIEVESIPGKFVFTSKGFFVFVLVAYMSSGFEGVYPISDKLAFSYKVFDGNNEMKSGRIEVSFKGEPFRNIHMSTKKFLCIYRDQYVDSIRGLCLMAAIKLDEELSEVY